MTLNIKKIMIEAHDNAKEKGFYDGDGKSVGDDIALMHSELSEALEEYRNNKPLTELYYMDTNPTKPEGVPSELADVIIRICEFSQYHGIDLEEAIKVKMVYNKSRPYKHGGKKI